jgi:DNA-binding NtrC family response regulator
MIVEHTLDALAAKGMPRFQVQPAAIEVLCRYNWPGNVRELRNLLEQLVVLGRPDHTIEARDLPPHLVAPRDLEHGAPAMPWQFGAGGIDFYREMEAIEDRIIAQALRLSRGNKKEAARLLHVNRTTLLEKLKRKRAQGSPLAVLLGGAHPETRDEFEVPAEAPPLTIAFPETKPAESDPLDERVANYAG